MTDLPLVVRPAWRTQWFLMVVCLVLFGVAVWASTGEVYMLSRWPIVPWVALALAIATLIYRRFLWRFEVDDSRLKSHMGIVSRNQQSVRLKDLRSIELKQSLMQRLFNVGELYFYTSGSAEAEVRFHGIKSPMEIRDHIKEIMDQAS